MILTPVALLLACQSATRAGKGSGVLQHHNNPSRDGVFVQPRLTKGAATTLQIDAAFASPTLGGALALLEGTVYVPYGGFGGTAATTTAG